MAVISQQIIDFFTENPDLSDEQIFSAMKKYKVSPSQLSEAVGMSEDQIISRLGAVVPPNEAVLLGDTWLQTNYQILGSGEDQQLGPFQSIAVYKTPGGINDKIPTGTVIQTYSPTGEFLGTTKSKKDVALSYAIKHTVRNLRAKVQSLLPEVHCEKISKRNNRLRRQ
jgi:hypothetical protein